MKGESSGESKIDMLKERIYEKRVSELPDINCYVHGLCENCIMWKIHHRRLSSSLAAFQSTLNWSKCDAYNISQRKQLWIAGGMHSRLRNILSRSSNWWCFRIIGSFHSTVGSHKVHNLQQANDGEMEKFRLLFSLQRELELRTDDASTPVKSLRNVFYEAPKNVSNKSLKFARETFRKIINIIEHWKHSGMMPSVINQVETWMQKFQYLSIKIILKLYLISLSFLALHPESFQCILVWIFH